MKKILFLLLSILTLSVGTAMAESYPVAELIKDVDITSVEIPDNAEIIDFGDCEVSVFSTSVNPTVSDAQKAQLSGTVSGGTISDDGTYIEFDNGSTASIYTLTINSGDYSVNGFCLQCRYGDNTFFEDIYLPTLTDSSAEINIVVNKPEATLNIATIKSDGKDAFSASGVPYPFEIVEGDAEDWIVSADGHTIEQYIGDNVDTLIIPNMIDGKLIFTVHNETLINQGIIGTLFGEYNSQTGITETAKSVEISDGIQVLGSFLFYQCTDLTGTIDIPYTARLIGPYAFAGCSKLTGNLDLSSCTALYPYSFAGCKGLKGTLTLPEVAVIPQGAFIDCPFSGTLKIPEGVQTIDNYAFALNSSGVAGTSALSLPSTLKTIGAVAFQHRQSFKNDLLLPDGLKHIGDFAFNHCTGFSNTSVYIPNTIETIGGDMGIVQGTMSENSGYGGHVFYNTLHWSTGFTSDNTGDFVAVDGVLLSSDMTRIVTYPIAKADESYIIPEGVTQLDEMSFGRTKVKSITLPDSFVFSTTVPENIINKDGNNFAVALYAYNSCEEVLTKDTNPNYISIDGIVYSKDKTTLWYVPNMHGAVHIEQGCEIIKNGAFFCSGSSTYTKWGTVIIPASVREIEANALAFINSSNATIVVDEDNEHFTVSNNKLVKK